MVIDFFIVMKKVPTVTHQEKQVHVVNGKPVFYEPDELKAARAKLSAHLTSKPDTDNLVKLLKDVMTELHFWKDDAQVASEVIEKYWADLPGIYVKVESL